MSRSLQLKVVTALQDRLSGPLQKIRGAGGQSAQSMKQLRDQLKSLESTQKTVNQFRELSRGVDQSRDSMQQAQAQANELAQRLQGVERPTAAMRREFTQATAASRRLKQEHQEQAQKLQGVRDRLHSAGVSTKSLSADERQLRERISSTNQALDQQRTRLGQVAQEQRKLAAAREQYQRTTATASNLAVTGAAGYASGRRVLGGMAGFMSDGMDFDKTMSRVQALARLDKDSIDMDALREQARQLGATTAFASNDAASGQAFLAMAGFTPDAIRAAMPDVLNMALAGDIDLGTTADISSNILSGMGMQAGEMGRVADVLTGAFTRSNTSLATLGETMKYAAPGAAQFGIDLETVAAMSAKLGDAGIQGSMAGTSIRNILTRLAAPSKAVKDAMGSIGLQVADSEGKMRPMEELLADLYERTRDLSEIERGAIFNALGGDRAGGALSILAENAGSGGLQELLSELRTNQGESADVAAKLADNAPGDLNLLKSAWSDLSIEIFTQNNDAIREVIQLFTSAAGAVGEWAKRNPELVSTLIKVTAVIAALMVGFGGIAITIAGILGPFAMMRYSMAVLGIRGGGLVRVLGSLGRTILPMVGKAILFVGRALMMNPIGLAVLAIAGAAFLIYKYWEPIKAFFSGLWGEVKAAFDGGIGAVGALILNWSPLGLIYKAFAGVLGYFGVELPDSLTGFVSSMWEKMASLFDGGIGSIGALIVNWSPLGLFYQAFAGVMDYLGVELPGKFSEFGSMIMSGLVNGIKGMGTAVKDSVVGIGESAVGWFKEKLDINSPSGVFMTLGSEISAGAALGIAQETSRATKAATAMAASVMAAGSLMPLSAGAFNDLPALRFDQRPGLSTAAGSVGGAAAGGGHVVYEGDQIEIHIHASAGMAAQDIATAVAAELDKRDRERSARSRSSLRDYGN